MYTIIIPWLSYSKFNTFKSSQISNRNFIIYHQCTE
ncbi:unnamed protein product [Schistosoma margrebowiei]|uniref:Uncharacterized protein n=1 Tax=Schistosoma margrebowiei TaxID=48269 RepID=A0A183M9Y9_9TREM|nr:unnamed protein product [Schistosoma margrebowiei]